MEDDKGAEIARLDWYEHDDVGEWQEFEIPEG